MWGKVSKMYNPINNLTGTRSYEMGYSSGRFGRNYYSAVVDFHLPYEPKKDYCLPEERTKLLDVFKWLS